MVDTLHIYDIASNKHCEQKLSTICCLFPFLSPIIIRETEAKKHC